MNVRVTLASASTPVAPLVGFQIKVGPCVSAVVKVMLPASMALSDASSTLAPIAPYTV